MDQDVSSSPSAAPSPPSRRSVRSSSRPHSQRVGLWRVFQLILVSGLLSATFFTMWTPSEVFLRPVSPGLTNPLAQASPTVTGQPAAAPVSTPTQVGKIRVGIVSGHWGNDSGAVCDDQTKEVDVNLRIATLVRQNLVEEGYFVDLLQEFDPKLKGYSAIALVSIHNDTCKYIDETKTGFKVAAAASDQHPEKANRLTDCLIQRYQTITGLRLEPLTITRDMSEYHAFGEINSNTPAAIIETGFLNLDKDILTRHPDKVAKGVTAGILCYIRNENVPTAPTSEAPNPNQKP